MSFNEKIISSFTSNFLSGHYYRPITSLTFVVDSISGEQSYFFYHLTNFLIHLFTSILIFLIIENLGYSLLASLIAALLFALNTIHINAVGWIAGRGDLLAAFFSSIALLFFLKFIKQNKSILLLLISLLLFLAILSKEVSLPVSFLFLIIYFIEKKELSLNKNSLGVLLMVVIVFSSYYLLRGVFLSGVHIDKFSFTTYYKNILVLPETISKFFIPMGIKALPSIEVFTSISGVIIFIVLLLIPFKFNSMNKHRYYFGLLWLILLLIPGMVFRTMEQDGFYYWDCRSYLPSVGIIFMIAEILRTIDIQKHKIFKYSTITIYLISLMTTSFIKIDLYKNPINYWNSVKADYPNRFLPYLGLHNYYKHLKDLENAEEQLLDGIKIRPEEFSIRQALINFYLNNNEKQKAFIQIKDAIKNKADSSVDLIENYISLAIELEKLNEIDELILEYYCDLKINSKIKEVIISKAEQLKNIGDIYKSNLLFQINRKLK